MTVTLQAPSATALHAVALEVANNEAAKGDLTGLLAYYLYTSLGQIFTDLTAHDTALVTAQAQVNVPLSGGILAAGTPLAAFADNSSSNPGITIVDSKAYAVRWNNNASQTAVWYGCAMPQDLDDTAPIVLHFLVSKTGATVGDATKMTVAAFFQTASALHDADTDCGGDSNALTGNAAAKTVTELMLTIAAIDVPPSPSNLSFSVKPKDGTLGTDDCVLTGMWIEYTRKQLSS